MVIFGDLKYFLKVGNTVWTLSPSTAQIEIELQILCLILGTPAINIKALHISLGHVTISIWNCLKQKMTFILLITVEH